MVKIEGLGWLGIRTERLEESPRFFREVMGLEETRRERGVVGFVLPDGISTLSRTLCAKVSSL